MDLNGTSPGSGYDQLNITGWLTIATSGTIPVLNVSLANGFTPSVGTPYTIITTTMGVTNAFAGLSDGSLFKVGGYLFQISYATNDVTITRVQETLTVTATGSQTYGGSNKTFTPQYSGFVLGDTSSVVSGLPTYSTTATNSSPVSGTYTATVTSVSALSATNYTFVIGAAGSYVVNQAALTITGTGSATYGDASATLGYQGSGFVLSQGPSVLSGTAMYTTSYHQGDAAGTNETVDVTGLTSSNYAISYMEGTFAVAQAPLSITASDQTQTYGFGGTSGSLGTSSFTSTGLQNHETIGSVTLTTNAATSTSGHYETDAYNSNNPWTISVSAATGGTFNPNNYTISYHDAPVGLTIHPAALTVTGVTANDKPYDATTAASLTFTNPQLVGTIYGNDDVSLDPSSYSATFSQANAGQSLPVTVMGLGLMGNQASDYQLTQPAGLTANINPAPVMVSLPTTGGIFTLKVSGTNYEISGTGIDTFLDIASTTGITINGSSSTDTLTINPTNFGTLSAGITFTGSTAADTLSLSGYTTVSTVDLTGYSSTTGSTGTVTVNSTLVSFSGVDHFTGVSDFTVASNSASIQAAINAVPASSTIHVDAGTYNEDLHVDNSLTVIGAGASQVIIDGSSPALTVTMGNVSYSGMTFTNTVNDGEAAVLVEGGTLTLSSSTVNASNGDAIDVFHGNYMAHPPAPAA